jgi:hypothetical protein
MIADALKWERFYQPIEQVWRIVMFNGSPKSNDLGIRLVADQMFVTSEATDRIHQDHGVIEREIRSEAVSTSGAFVSAGPLIVGPGDSHRQGQTGVLRFPFGSIHLESASNQKYSNPGPKCNELTFGVFSRIDCMSIMTSIDKACNIAKTAVE